MNKIEKFLRRLRKKEQEVFLLIFGQLQENFRKLPHAKPLVGKKGWFRIRVGRYRIIFAVRGKEVEIMRITKRDDQTYRNLG